MKCPKCGAVEPHFGVITDLEGNLEPGHNYCVKCGHTHIVGGE